MLSKKPAVAVLASSSSSPTEIAVDPSSVAAARSEGPPQVTGTSDDDDEAALWIVYSSAAAVGVAVAAFIVGFFLVKNNLHNKRRNDGYGDGSQNSKARSKRMKESDSAKDPSNSHKSRSTKSMKESPSAKVPVNENTDEEGTEDLEANTQSDEQSAPSRHSSLFGLKGTKKRKASVPSEEPASVESFDGEKVGMVNWNSGDEFEVALGPKEESEGGGAASKFFTSVASVIFPSETNDYFEKEEKTSLPSKEEIDMFKSVYTVQLPSNASVSNNTFNTFFQNLGVVVNEGADTSTYMPEAEMETPSVKDRMNLAITPKQVSDITMSCQTIYSTS